MIQRQIAKTKLQYQKPFERVSDGQNKTAADGKQRPVESESSHPPDRNKEEADTQITSQAYQRP